MRVTVRRMPLDPPTVVWTVANGEAVLYADPSIPRDLLDHALLGARLGTQPPQPVAVLPVPAPRSTTVEVLPSAVQIPLTS